MREAQKPLIRAKSQLCLYCANLRFAYTRVSPTQLLQCSYITLWCITIAKGI
jgi:hypothetical protein